MILSVMQPTYLPWLGYFDLIDSADKFVFLDNVKLEKSDWHVRNRIKGANGELMLSCAVSTPSGRMTANINTTKFAVGHPWRKKHLKSLTACYRKAPFFEPLFERLSDIYNDQSISLLGQFNITIISSLAQYIGIQTELLVASQLPQLAGVKDQRLANMCQQLGCSHYLSPVGAQGYIEAEQAGGKLAQNGFEVSYQNFTHPTHAQLYGEFISHLSVVDCLFNVGPEQTYQLIKSGQGKAVSYRDL